MLSLSVLFVSISLLNFAQCRPHISNDIDNDILSTPGWLKINQKPTRSLKKKVGDHVELSCSAMGTPPPTIQWYKRNQRLVENDSFEITNSIIGPTAMAEVNARLVINYLLPRHSDIYTCEAIAGVHEEQESSKLMIINKEGREMNFTQLIAAKILGAHHLPRVTFWASTYMDVIGNNVVLPCRFVGNPKPTLIWMGPNKKIIDNSEKYSIFPDGELRIKSIEWSDMGKYTCSVENSVGEDSIETFLYPMKEESISNE